MSSNLPRQHDVITRCLIGDVCLQPAHLFTNRDYFFRTNPCN
jgi:hypothetical protein